MQLIGSSFAIGLLASLSGCVTSEEPGEVPGCRTIDCVTLGEAQEVGPNKGELVVIPLEVVEDSRCPVEAECVWEGRVRVRSELRLGHEMIDVDLTTEQPLRINGGMLTIAEVAPDMSVEWSPILAGAYRFGFRFAPDIMETPSPAA